jgi:hypothetical protein
MPVRPTWGQFLAKLQRERPFSLLKEEIETKHRGGFLLTYLFWICEFSK